jgi:hypothetical protein
MNHVTFDVNVRRATGLLDRRSLFGGVSAALLAVGGVPLDLRAKKKRKKKAKACRTRVKRCRQDGRSTCADPDAPENCEAIFKKCCKKVCQSVAKVDRCLSENF